MQSSGSIGLCLVWQTRPLCIASYAISVRQTGSLPVSALHCLHIRLPSDSTSRWTPLPSANSSYCQVCSGLSPPSYCPCRAHQKWKALLGSAPGRAFALCRKICRRQASAITGRSVNAPGRGVLCAGTVVPPDRAPLKLSITGCGPCAGMRRCAGSTVKIFFPEPTVVPALVPGHTGAA